jgi:hypothetical protein
VICACVCVACILICNIVDVLLHLHKPSFCIKDEASCWCSDMNN